jgi:hypothetical protein
MNEARNEENENLKMHTVGRLLIYKQCKKENKNMKLNRSLLRNQVIWFIAATLSVAFPVKAQSFGTGTATSTFQVVDNSVGGNTIYNCSATANVQMAPYVTQNGSYYFTATLTAECSLVSGPAPGVGVVIFGQNSSLTHSTSIDNAYTEPFGGSTITLGSYPYDYWDDAVGNYEATYQDYNVDAGGPAVQLGFSVGYDQFSLTITPIYSDHTITLCGPPSGANGQILMKDILSTTATSSFQTRFSGIFENGDYVKINNIQLNDSSASGGGEIGYVTLSIPLTGAHTYYNYSDNFPLGSPTVDSFTQGPTMTIQVPYVRDQGILMPTVSVTQSADQVQVGQTVILNVQVFNNSQAVSLGNVSQDVQVSINSSSYSPWFSLASGQSSAMSVAAIPINSSHTFSFRLVAQEATPAGGISPQVSVGAGWGSPATTKQNYAPGYIFSANQPIVVSQPPAVITVQANPSNGGTVSGGGTFNVGSQRQISASPASGWTFTGWSDNGSTQTPRTIMVPAGGATYTANFVQPNATVTVQANPSNGGTVNGSGSYSVGSQVQISASPNNDWTFSGWSDNGSTQSPRTITVPSGGATYTANFTIIQYTVTPSAGANGTINPNTVQTINSGGSVTFTATPASGYVVSQWVVNNSVAQTGGTSYTLNNVTANTPVQVTFTTAPTTTYTVTPSAGANGTINPDTVQTVNSAGSVSFTATPASGYVVSQWLVNNGIVQTGGTSYTVNNVTAATSVQVTFTTAPTTTYTVTPNAGANGTINPNTAQTVNSGGSVTFTATPANGYVVSQWLVNNGIVQTGGTS